MLTRSVPPAARRALRSRDRSCRFPGCGQRRFLHAHHVEHWAHGGRTDLSNLIQLCAHHHRLVHEGRYRIERAARAALRFRRTDGREVPAVPARARGDAAQLTGRNRRQRLKIGSETSVPHWHGDPLERTWVVAELVERDPRLRE